jgi:hypothetical protein
MLLRLFAGLLLCFAALQPAVGGDWKVGLARTVITPSAPTWLSGYSNRDRPAEGKVHDLHAKAVAFESTGGARLVLVTCDLGSIYQELTDAVAAEAHKRFGLPPSHLVINVSHTHCAPEVAKERIVFHDLTAAEEAKLADYIANQLQPKLIDVVGAALSDLRPAKLLLNQSSANFANNRRAPRGGNIVNDQNPAGVVDHDVPVLQVLSPDGKLRGVLFGYACHNTTLAFYQYCGDYAGFAQQFVEAAHPAATALFVMGCGGDQNPYPRHGPKGLESCRRHGRELADAVESSLGRAAAEIHGPLRVAGETVTLDLEPLPPIERLKHEAASPNGHSRRKARYLLSEREKHGKIELTQGCPIQAAKFGEELLMIFISGETVVDYSRKSKAEFAGPMVWVAGYCNDVFAYLPSLRVLKEGAYEGRTGIVHQLVATPFAPTVEERVMDGVRKAVAAVSH